MKGREYKGAIEGWPGKRGDNVGDAIIKTLDEYEGDSDDVHMKVFIITNAKNKNEKSYGFVSVDVQWIENAESWRVLRYY